MPSTAKRRKYKLAYGDATAIAQRLGQSVPHVTLCARGKREPGPELRAELERVEALRVAEARNEKSAAVA